MDTSDPRIVFDQDGFCNHCTEFLNIRSRYRFEGEAGKEKLDSLGDEIKRAGRGNKYDCIVGMSGGVDSSYVAYLVCEMGLRPLAVHMDNGWDSEEAVSNVRKLTSQLGIDYQSYVLDWEEFRKLQVSFLKASVPEAETPTDVAIPAALHHFAAKNNIKYIISAGNLTTEGILPKSWHYNAKDLKYLDHIQNTFGQARLKNFPVFDYKKELYFKLIKGIRILYLLNYVKFTQDEVTNFLIEKFDYRTCGEKHHESRYTRFIQSYYLYEKFGIDYRRARSSSEICSGQTTRDEALKRLRNKPYDPEDIAREKQYVAKKLQLSIDEFEQILARPPKWYWDYPNDERKLGFIYGFYLKFFGKEKLANF
jgi:N-acetyl sugar amidotransferase